MAAMQEENRQRVENRLMTTVAMSARDSTGQGTAPERPRARCTHCRKAFHTADKCWHLHPGLKEEWEKSKGRRVNKVNRRNQQAWAQAPVPLALVAHTQAPPARYYPPTVLEAPTLKEVPDSSEGAYGVFMMAHTDVQQSNPTDRFFELLRQVFILDSGATRHITCTDENLSEHQVWHGQPISGVGGHQLRPKTCGRLTFDASVHGQKVRTNLPGSLCEPNAGSNLLSISQLTDSGSTIVMTRSGAAVTVTLTATRMNGLYIVDRWSPGTVGTPLPAFPSFSITDPGLDVWHQRLGHLGEQSLQQVISMSTGI